MDKVSIPEIQTLDAVLPPDVFKPLACVLGTAHVSINYYELVPGDQIGFEIHRHHDQEEIFFVREGTLVFETPDEEVEIGPRELVRFAPGEFQLGRNRSAGRASVLAIGAPRETREIEYYRSCETCDERTVHVPDRPASYVLALRCRECDRVNREIEYRWNPGQ